ncbi:MAG: AraC family transcriptional regulator [Pseudomonadota bacterium]
MKDKLSSAKVIQTCVDTQTMSVISRYASLGNGLDCIVGDIRTRASENIPLQEPIKGLVIFIPTSGVSNGRMNIYNVELSLAAGYAYIYSSDAGPYTMFLEDCGTYSGLKFYLRDEVLERWSEKLGELHIFQRYISDRTMPIFTQVELTTSVAEGAVRTIEEMRSLDHLCPNSLAHARSTAYRIVELVHDKQNRVGAEEPSTLLIKIRAADNYLRDHIQSAPSVLELASIIGLNHMTMKRGFNRVYGMSVYGRLRTHRMQKASTLLRNGEKVSYVASTVGYANPSKFSAAFKRMYGISPSKI